MRWSKTIQYRNRTLLVPVPNSAPIEQFVHAFNLVAAHDSATLRNGPAFVYTSGDQIKLLTYTTFTTKLKKLLEQCGYDSSQYSGHSFRRGGATFALNCGVPGHDIKLQGDWLSNAYERYLVGYFAAVYDYRRQRDEQVYHSLIFPPLLWGSLGSIAYRLRPGMD